MENQNTPTVKISRDNKTLIVNFGDRTALISANLVKHLIEVEYTKKDGTVVSVPEIQAQKQMAKEAYAAAVARNAKKAAGQ